jgi:uncharacterized membrane protein YdcZ (DUF606 family)
LESVFIIHIGGAFFALIPLLIYGGGKLGNWRTVPWYALCAGAFGLVVIFSMSYMIPRVGIATALIILLSVNSYRNHGSLGYRVQDHGLRVLGLAVVLLGAWLSMK